MNLTLIDEYAREKLGRSSEWRAYHFSAAREDAPDGFVKIIGADTPLNSAGKPNWLRRNKSTEKTFFVSEVEYDQWWNDRADKAGVCRVCLGKLKVWCGFDHIKGTCFKPCGTCQSHLPATLTWEIPRESSLFDGAGEGTGEK